MCGTSPNGRSSDYFDCLRKIKSQTLQDIIEQPLAFSTSSTLVAASFRLPFIVADESAILNVEFFEADTSPSSPLLLFIHGICVSCETKSVQNLVSAAKNHSVNVAVLEIEGHGLSSGHRGYVDNFDRLICHVLEFVSHTLTMLGERHGRSDVSIPYAIGGCSFGGTLSAYAASQIVKPPSSIKLNFPGRFLGVAPLSPAVGVDPKVTPSFCITQLLKALSCVAPRLQPPLTPLEDPKACSCPPDSKRNFAGNWPLGTSKLLLDVTSNRVKLDLSRSKGHARKLDLSGVPSVLVMSGEADEIVPFEFVRAFYDALDPNQKEIVGISGAGHDLLTDRPFCDRATSQLFQWMNKLVGGDT